MNLPGSAGVSPAFLKTISLNQFLFTRKIFFFAGKTPALPNYFFFAGGTPALPDYFFAGGTPALPDF